MKKIQKRKRRISSAHRMAAPKNNTAIGQYKDALRESEERFKSIYEQSPVGIALFNTEGNIIDSNPKYLKILGIKSIDCIKSFNIFEEPKITDEQKKKILNGKVVEYKTFFDFDLVRKKRLYETEHSGKFFIKVHISPWKGANKKTRGFLVRMQDITSQNLIEEALKKNEENYRELTDSIKDAFFAMDKNFKYTYWNKTHEKLTGISAKNAIGKSVYELYPSFKGTAGEKIYKEVLKTQMPRSFVSKRNLKDKDFFLEVNVYPFKNGLSVFVRDITRIKQNEESLCESENRFRLAMDAASMISWERNLKTNRVIYSRDFAEFFGLPKESEYDNSDTASLAVHPDDLERLNNTVELSIETGKGFEFEFRGPPQNGRQEWFYSKGVVSYEEKGLPARITGVTMNITARKQAEQALRESEEKFRKLAESAQDGIIIADNNANIIFWNKAAEKILGYTSEESIGKTIYSLLIRSEYHQSFINRFDDFRKTGEGPLIDEVSQINTVRRDGTGLWIDISRFSIELGGKWNTIGIIRDITGRKQAEEELSNAKSRQEILSKLLIEAQETERKRIACELHDEIGQALTALKMNLESSQQFHKTSNLALPVLKDSAEIIEKLIEQVRNLSLELRPSTLDDLGLVATLKWYTERIRKRSGLNFAFISNGISKHLNPIIEITCFRIAQEALTNVLRHSKAKNIKVELGLEDNKMHLFVRDDGIGFELTDIKKRILQGASLGLLNMQERVLLINGTLKIKTAPNQGTEVHAYFPLNQPDIRGKEK